MRNTTMLAVLALSTIACAGTTPAPVSPVPAASGQAELLPSASLPATDELRHELEQAYAHILSRKQAEAEPPVGIPVVDIEAAASIPIPEHRTINSAVELFSVRMKNSIQTSLLRSGRYRQFIDKTLAAEKLPKGLAYLPVIESAYLPTLTSKAGAHGIWQFMPDTAREYGMRVDWWVDERADPEVSTRAAVRYLKDLHRMFGDWSLALAAYNCGPGRVRRTLQSAGATSFWELLDQGLLPKETRGYVPTFYATLLIASDPESYGFELGQVEESDGNLVDVRGPVSLTYIAEALGVRETTLQELNPALRRGVVPPGRHPVRVPAKLAETLQARADSLREEDVHVKYTSHKMRAGDTIQKLARKIGTKPETILAMNGLRDGARVATGRSIYLPVRTRELGTLLAHSDNKTFYYAVRKGDTLYSIAKRNGLSIAELRELNDLGSKSTLRIGQKLRVSAPRTLSAGGM